jgi:hypothetical protein
MRAERDGDDVGLTLSATEARYLLRVAQETVLGIDLEHSRSAAEGYEELQPEAIEARRFFRDLAGRLEAALGAQGGIQIRENR